MLLLPPECGTCQILQKSHIIMKITALVYFLACLISSVMSFRYFSRAPMSISRSGVRMLSEEQEFRTFAGYNIYKGKGAINVVPIPPTFSVTDRSQSIHRNGALLLEFAPAGTGPREYDWSKKATFSLSVTECGEISRLKEGASTEFTHDPGANTADAGKVTKKLKWTPAPDGKAVFVSLAVTDKGNASGSVMYSLPVSLAEVEVMKSIMTFCIPRFLGLHRMF